MSGIIYLDNQATTPTDPAVVAAMLPYFTEKFGNAGSITHAYGREAEEAVERARGQVAALIGAEAREIVFTSGATESNNLALKGAAHFHRVQGRDHLVIAVSEHKCVLESARALERAGFRVTSLPIDKNGFVDPVKLDAAIEERTFLVSIMAANNEIGVIQDLAALGAVARARGVLFHSDAAQAVGKVPLDVEAMKIDLLSISGHKIYGPKGIGALYVRRRPRARIAPLFDGGGQERGLRSGTAPVPLCVGLGEAAERSARVRESEAARLKDFRARLLAGLRARLPDLIVNGDLERRLPGNLNLSFPGVPALALMKECPDLALSTGSACTATEVEPSHVLRALGLSEALARSTLRIGLGRFTTEAEIGAAIEALAAGARRLKGLGVEAGDDYIKELEGQGVTGTWREHRH
ncbi:MAG TPA: aminotransferase class V-fold PLP-dependent enzyme [Stellaceae bacterium]|nr:aminotransferase class V-fold PLP-dependent enzyme [Stellaceae bacterium]